MRGIRKLSDGRYSSSKFCAEVRRDAGKVFTLAADHEEPLIGATVAIVRIARADSASGFR
jgi:hypothetical protein